MRLPVIGNISTKDGATNKNARLTNMLAEQKKNGTTLATVRPGLNKAAETTGNGNGAVCFGGTLVNVFGATLGVIYPSEADYTHVINTDTAYSTIWNAVDYVGTTLVGSSGGSIYKSDDDGATTSFVSAAPVGPDQGTGLINKGGQMYLLKDAGTNSVYRDGSDYGATWSAVGDNAIVYPSCVSGSNIYGLVIGEVVDEELEETVGFSVRVYTTTDMTSITASTSLVTITGDLVSPGYGCMTVIDGVIHVLVASTTNDLLYHFKYASGSWSYTTQAFINNEYIPSTNRRCYEIGGKIYFITCSSPTNEVTLRRIDPNDDTLEIYYSLGVVSGGAIYHWLIYNGTTLTVCIEYSGNMEYHHFTNISSYEYSVVTTAALNEDDTYDFALIP